MKRFWREVRVTPLAAGHQIELDPRPLRTPARHALVPPSAALAEAIAGEWRAQGEEVETKDPLSTQGDGVLPQIVVGDRQPPPVPRAVDLDREPLVVPPRVEVRPAPWGAAYHLTVGSR